MDGAADSGLYDPSSIPQKLFRVKILTLLYSTVPIPTLKLITIGPEQYLDRRPLGNSWCWFWKSMILSNEWTLSNPDPTPQVADPVLVSVSGEVTSSNMTETGGKTLFQVATLKCHFLSPEPGHSISSPLLSKPNITPSRFLLIKISLFQDCHAVSFTAISLD